ncbi:MAG TPA: radical SAM protein [Phycisphaerae bacterium]|nr:radical SAM protein [Phycisphaerae bacterium]HNU45432.1 radical SAM protein [Phycisphaerae bacterium]
MGPAQTEELADLRERVEAETPLDAETGLRMATTLDIHTAGELANAVRERWHGRNAYYNINLHINYTNYCMLRCKFCSFYRAYPKTHPLALPSPPEREWEWEAAAEPAGGAPGLQEMEGPAARPADGYELTVAEIVARAKAAYARGATEVHIVGGLHPKLPFSYYTEMVADIRAACPHLHVKAFTAIEIIHFTRIARPRLSIADVLRELRSAGLDSLPGGGAEIFDERVHEEAFQQKMGADEWFDVHRVAHEMGIFTNATMLYGHVETPAERVRHLLRLREHQERSLRECPAHFNCVVPLSFIPAGSALAHLPGPSGLDDLRTIALTRLLCDNVPHVKAFWPMLSPKIAQLALCWGADDLDGTVVHYDITHREARACADGHGGDAACGQGAESAEGAAGDGSASAEELRSGRRAGGFSRQELTVEELSRLIVEAGCTPVERDSLYRRVHRDEDAWCIEGEAWSVGFDGGAFQ